MQQCRYKGNGGLPCAAAKESSPLADVQPRGRSPGAGVPRRPGTEPPMIRLTRLNNQPLAVNSDLVKFIEQAPDTVITLITGEKIIVRESAEQVLDRIVEFRRSVLRGLTVVSDWSVNAATSFGGDRERDEQE